MVDPACPDPHTARLAAPAGLPVAPRGRGRTAILGVVGVVVASALVGCAGGDAADLAVHRLEGELARLRAQNAALSERVDALEIRADGLRALPSSATSASTPAIAPREDDRPALEVVRLVPTGAPRAKTPPARAPGGDAAARAEVADAELGRAESLLGAKKYDAALDAFAGFVVRYPEHPRAAEATLRRGACYLHKKQPERAVEHVEAALAAPLPPALVAEALELLAHAHEDAGDPAAARRARERLRNQPPEPPVVTKLESREGSR